jgi:hypothetical protein
MLFAVALVGVPLQLGVGTRTSFGPTGVLAGTWTFHIGLRGHVYPADDDPVLVTDVNTGASYVTWVDKGTFVMRLPPGTFSVMGLALGDYVGSSLITTAPPRFAPEVHVRSGVVTTVRLALSIS